MTSLFHSSLSPAIHLLFPGNQYYQLLICPSREPSCIHRNIWVFLLKIAANNTFWTNQFSVQCVSWSSFPISIYRASLFCFNLLGICHFAVVSYLINQSPFSRHLCYFPSCVTMHNLILTSSCTCASLLVW